MLGLLGIHCSIAQVDIQFKRLSVNEGLSFSTVQCISKDRRGFIWIGTRDGLNRYDGYDVKVYRNNPNDSSSIVNEKVNDLLEDDLGNLWIATSKGLDRYDTDTESFVHYKLTEDAAAVREIFQASDATLWLSTELGLFSFKNDGKDVKKFQHDASDPSTLRTNDIIRTVEDDDGNLWIATGNGVERFNRATQTFTHFIHDPSNPHSIGGNYIRSIYKDRLGNIWVVARDAGLALFNKKEESFTTFVYDPNNKNSISHNDLITVTDGPDGKLWIGTDKKGICRYDVETGKFTSFLFEPRDKTIRCFYKDNIGDFWIGTHEGGVLFLAKSGNQVSYFKSHPFNVNSLTSNLISAIIEDSDGDMWIGTDAGVNQVEKKTGNFIHYKSEPGNRNSLSNDNNYAVIEIGKDTLAFGNYKGGLMFFNKKTKRFTHYPLSQLDQANGLPGTVSQIRRIRGGNVAVATSAGLLIYHLRSKTFKMLLVKPPKTLFSLYEDRSGKLLVGGNDGLFVFDRNFVLEGNYLIDPANNINLTNNRVHCILEDKYGNIWVSTNGGGLNLFDQKTKTFTTYKKENGIPNNTVYGILEDSNGNLWLSTPSGIGKFNIKTRSCVRYDLEVGEQKNEFSRGAYYKNADGQMFFGGSDGVVSFHPDSIKNNTYIPPVVITDFQIFNKSVGWKEPDAVLKKSISETKEIVLSHEQSVFTFAFAALNYTHSEKNQYAYKLTPFDKDWNHVGTQRKATYTNLDPGTYTFNVRASNNDGTWNEDGASVTIIITPPYWKTWWFNTLCVLFVIGSAVSFYRIRINSIKNQKILLQREVRERTMEVVRQKEEIEDSIRAAKAIQSSILPSENLVKKYLPESFIFYKPKDVVSGDFFWFLVKEEKIVIAAVDCTGHGVSGAFMSINGYHLLNKAIDPGKELIASEVLNRLNYSVINELYQPDKDNQLGMDIALCVLDKDKRKLHYAGANNPLYILRSEEIIQIKANKYGIGLSVGDKINSFDNHEVLLQQGDILYIFSDGYADQIGGPNSEKFMYSRFRELLLTIRNEAMADQARILNENFKNWLGTNEQLDDILVIGFKV